MKTKKWINAEISKTTGTVFTNFYTAIYDTPEGRERGKNYLTQEAAKEEARVFCECLNYKLLYIDNNLLFCR